MRVDCGETGVIGRIILRTVARLLILGVVTTAILPASAFGQSAALKEVLLSAGGVGYFEYEAAVTGDAELAIPVRLDQVDDVLRSFTVYDAGGGVAQVTLPGRWPLERRFRDLPFAPEDLTSLAATLAALPGTPVELGSGPDRVSGRVMGVVPETVTLPDGGTAARHRLTVLTDGGARQLLLEEVAELRFADPELDRQLRAGLAALADNAARDRRTLRVALSGVGLRRVRLAYAVQAPVWKATYRLTLDPVPAELGAPTTARLQGWASVENDTATDWEGVSLTLSAGAPRVLTQALYTPHYVAGEAVPLPGQAAARPDRPVVDGPAIAVARDARALADEAIEAARQAAQAAQQAAHAAGQAAREAGAAGQFVESRLFNTAQRAMGTAGEEPDLLAALPVPETLAAIDAGTAAEAATQILFALPDGVSVPSGHSLLVPILDRRVSVRRVSVLPAGSGSPVPDAAVLIENDGDVGLPAGLVTLYERTGPAGGGQLAGTGWLEQTAPGGQRRVTFAADEKMRVSRRSRTATQTVGIKASAGSLTVTRAAVRETTYTADAPPREPRRLLIVHPLADGFAAAIPPEVPVAAEGRNRILTLDIAAGAEATVTVRETRPQAQTLAVGDLSEADFDAFATGAALDQPLRDALQGIIARRGAVAEIEGARQRLAESRAAIVQDQGRLRDNLAAVPPESDLHRRTLDRLQRSDEDLERIDRRLAELDAALEAAEADYRRAVQALTLP